MAPTSERDRVRAYRNHLFLGNIVVGVVNQGSIAVLVVVLVSQHLRVEPRDIGGSVWPARSAPAKMMCQMVQAAQIGRCRTSGRGGMLISRVCPRECAPGRLGSGVGHGGWDACGGLEGKVYGRTCAPSMMPPSPLSSSSAAVGRRAQSFASSSWIFKLATFLTLAPTDEPGHRVGSTVHEANAGNGVDASVVER